MDRDSASWLREATKFYLMYLAVGAAFAPFGFVYGLLALKGWNHPLAGLVLLAGGFLTARFVWERVHRRLFVRPARVIQGLPASASRAVPAPVRQGGVTRCDRFGENGWSMPRVVVDHGHSGVPRSIETETIVLAAS